MKPTQAKSSIGSQNYQWALTLIHYFSLHGVTQAVISPGSRSTPLALACEQHPNITTWLQIDERSAAFFALGLAQERHQPTLLICTSGSAVANWLPAVVEANHADSPLILLSADRPAQLHHCGANQTIEQTGIFSSHVRASIQLSPVNQNSLESNYLPLVAAQAYHQSLSPKPGPVHINIPFQEPLLPQNSDSKQLNHSIRQITQTIIPKITIQKNMHHETFSTDKKLLSNEDLGRLLKIINSGNGLIVCGRLNTHEQEQFTQLLPLLADKLNCPVFVDPLSRQRFGTQPKEHFLFNYDHFLKSFATHRQAFEQPKWLIYFGQFPVSKSLFMYLQDLEAYHIFISSYGDSHDPIHKADEQFHLLPYELCQQLVTQPIPACSEQWHSFWQKQEQQAEQQITQALTALPNNAFFEGQIINSLLKYIPDNSILFSGNSMAIRDFDTFITHVSAAQKCLHFFANRGTSGIDGNISSFLGLLASQKGYGVALLGDLTFYHDMNGLLICQELAKQGYRASIIIINNNGGGIFNYLPQKQLNEFDKLWKTQINLDFQHSAKLYGLHYHRIEHLDNLDTTLQNAFYAPEIQLIEIIVNQEISVECHQ